MQITIPIIWIRGSLYLVGDKKINLDKNGEYVNANIGGGKKPLEEYVQKNHKTFERALLIKMFSSRQSLESVLDAIINGTKIPSIQPMNYAKTLGNSGDDDFKKLQI